MPLHDYLYVDLPKVISLYSQITGGIVESREATKELARSVDNKRNYDLKVFRHDAGGTEHDKNGFKEFIKPHHSLLAELEKELSNKGYLLDLTQANQNWSLREPRLRELLTKSLCIKVTGRAVIEDYARLKVVANAFPDVAALINKSIESNLKNSSEYKQMQAQLESLEAQVKGDKNHTAKAEREKAIRACHQINQMKADAR